MCAGQVYVTRKRAGWCREHFSIVDKLFLSLIHRSVLALSRLPRLDQSWLQSAAIKSGLLSHFSIFSQSENTWSKLTINSFLSMTIASLDQTSLHWPCALCSSRPLTTLSMVSTLCIAPLRASRRNHLHFADDLGAPYVDLFWPLAGCSRWSRRIANWPM